MDRKRVTVSDVDHSDADGGKSLELAEGGLFTAFLRDKKNNKPITTGASSYVINSKSKLVPTQNLALPSQI